MMPRTLCHAALAGALLLAACVHMPQPGMHRPTRDQIARAMVAHIQPCQPDSDGISTCDVMASGFDISAARCGSTGSDIQGAPVIFCRVTYRSVFPGGWRAPDRSTICRAFRRNPGHGWQVAEIDGEQDRCGKP